MDRYKRISSSILSVLSEYPKGISIKDLSDRVGLHRNVLAKYLKILEAQGKIDITRSGTASYIKRSYRIFADIFQNYNISPVIVFNHELKVVMINEKGVHWFSGLKENTSLHNARPEYLKEIFGDDIRKCLISAVNGIKTDLKFQEFEGDQENISQQCIPVVFDDGTHGAALLVENILDNNILRNKQNIQAYEALLNDHIQFIVRFSKEGKIIFMNRSFSRHLGYEDTGLMHPMFIMPYPEEEFVKFKQKIATIISREDIIHIDIRRILPDGELCYERWKIQGFFDDNKLIEYHASGLDITEHIINEKHVSLNYEKLMQLMEDTTSELKEANQDLHKEILRREKLEIELSLIRYAVDSAKDLMFILKSDGSIFFTNKIVEEITNISLESLKGVCIDEILAFEEDITKPSISFMQLQKSFNHYPVTKNGYFSMPRLKHTHLEILIHDVEDLTEDYYYIIARDISERIKSERLLLEHEEQYRLIADNTIDVTLLINIEPFKMLYVSPSCVDLLGYSPEECRSRPDDTILSAIEYDKNLVKMHERIESYLCGDESARSYRDFCHLAHKDGTLIRADVVSTLIKNEDKVAQIFFVIKKVNLPDIPEYHSSMQKYLALWPKT